MRIAYLCSEYPAISHTFVLREVEALRRLGASIDTFSIRRTSRERLLSQADREADATTTAILPARLGRLLAGNMRLLARAPIAYLSTLRFALRLAPPGLRGRLWQLFYFVEAVLLWDECQERGIEHIHVHLANSAADVAMIAARLGTALERRRGGAGRGGAGLQSWSFTMHGPTEFFDLSRFRLEQKVASARFVVCISDFARSQLMALAAPEHWDRLDVVHMGIPVQDFAPSRAAAAEALPHILYIGRLVPEKGQAVLLEAIARLAQRGFLVEATLAGEGSLRAGLERRAARLGIASQVRFPGAVGQEELRGLYESADLFCLPSFAEGVPVVLMEAMAMEVPVISTKIAGIPELIEDGHSGLLVAPGRADELADRIEALLADPQLRRRLGGAGREKVLCEFDAERCAEQLYELFASELGSGTASAAEPESPAKPESGAQPEVAKVGA